MNRAVMGDVVAVEILPEEEWRAPNEEVVDQDGKCLSLKFIVNIETDENMWCSGAQE